MGLDSTDGRIWQKCALCTIGSSRYPSMYPATLVAKCVRPHCSGTSKSAMSFISHAKADKSACSSYVPIAKSLSKLTVTGEV